MSCFLFVKSFEVPFALTSLPRSHLASVNPHPARSRQEVKEVSKCQSKGSAMYQVRVVSVSGPSDIKPSAYIFHFR